MAELTILPNRQQSSRPADPWRHGEPSLAEAMADPLVHLVMGRDGLGPDTVWPWMLEARQRLLARLCRLAA